MINKIKPYLFENENDVFIYLACLENGINPDKYVSLSENDLIKIKLNKLAVKDYSTGLWKTILNEKVKIEDDVDRYREVFSKEKSGYIGKMGSKQGCIKKLKKFFKVHPEYDMNDVIKAGEFYVKNHVEISGFLQQADYFIEKNGTSRLETVLEELHRSNKVDTTYGGDII